MTAANRIESFMLKLINAERADASLRPLKFDRSLNEAAEQHSGWMLRTDIFSHSGKEGSDPQERMDAADYSASDSFSWGENVAWRSLGPSSSYKDEVRALHESLMNSPGHRANILSEDFREIGIGIEVGEFNGWDAIVVTQDFGWDFA